MKHLLKLSDLGKKEILGILNIADQMKFSLAHRLEKRSLTDKTLAMIFAEPSARTRVSFETGMYQLGGQALFLSANDMQKEPIEDMARVLSSYVDGFMLCGFPQQAAEDFIKYSSVPVINGFSDLAHPCQVLACLMTAREKFFTLEDLKICFIGTGGNFCNSLIAGAITCGMKISVASPKGCEPHPDILKWAEGKLHLTHDPFEAAENADVVCTDVRRGISDEYGTEARPTALQGFQVNSDLMRAASPEAMVQHCLPVRRGEEITDEVFEEHSKEIFDAAGNLLHVQKAVMVMLMGSDEE